MDCRHFDTTEAYDSMVNLCGADDANELAKEIINHALFCEADGWDDVSIVIDIVDDYDMTSGHVCQLLGIDSEAVDRSIDAEISEAEPFNPADFA